VREVADKDVGNVACDCSALHFIDPDGSFERAGGFDRFNDLHAVLPCYLPCLFDVVG